MFITLFNPYDRIQWSNISWTCPYKVSTSVIFQLRFKVLRLIVKVFPIWNEDNHVCEIVVNFQKKYGHMQSFPAQGCTELPNKSDLKCEWNSEDIAVYIYVYRYILNSNVCPEFQYWYKKFHLPVHFEIKMDQIMDQNKFTQY